MAIACGDDACQGTEEVCTTGAIVTGTWQEHEESAVLEMARLGRQIRRQQDGQVDVASRTGRDAARKLLSCVDGVVRVLGVQLAPQTYRESIPESVTAPWTQAGSRYSIQVLAASVQHWRDIIMNNQVFLLSAEARLLSRKLCRRWADIGLLLRDLRRRGPSAVPRATAVTTLEAFDRAWAAFEHKFLAELHVMQTEAKDPLAPLMKAAEHACSLQAIHQRFDLETQVQEMVDDPEYQEEHRLLVETITRLNLVANPQNTGYGFTVQTLNELEAVIEQCELSQPDPQEYSKNPSLMLAVDAVEAFNSLCTYFYQVKNCMDSVDPNLSNNKGLVERLARWEATWGRAADHVLDPLGRQALETLTASIRKVQASSPELVEMCEECSADMFLALPRLAWLSFLASPVELSPEVQCLLPHRFQEMRGVDGELGCYPGDELRSLLDERERVLDLIAAAVASEAMEDPAVQARVLAVGAEEAKRELAAGLLSRSAVLGSGGDLEKYTTILTSGPEGLEAREACEAFVRGLESWSIELQRHNARDWNTFVAVVVRCLNVDLEKAGKGADDTFQV